MFERFTGPARQVVVFAQEEARGRKHNFIGTEHLLLGLLAQQDDLAHRALDSVGMTLEAARDDVGAICGRGDEVVGGRIPFTPRAKKVLELALREAMSLGHDYIGTEHVLLGLVREGEGVAVEIIHRHGIDPEQVRERVFDLLAVRDPQPGAGRRLGRITSRFSTRSTWRWEYSVRRRDTVDEGWLNELGADGWELVSVVPERDGFAAVFKRRQALGALRAAS